MGLTNHINLIIMKKLYLFAAIIILFALPSIAQEGTFGLQFTLSVPQGSFADNVKQVGPGLSFNGGYRFKNTPVSLGAELGFTNFGIDRRTVPWSSTIPDLKVNVDNNYNLAQAFFLTRIGAPNGPFRPYVEGLVGLNYFFTETTVSSRGGAHAGEPIASDTNYDDTAFAYGIGAGFKVQLYNFRGGSVGNGDIPAKKGFLNLSARYIRGGEARYLTKGSITITDQSQVIYNPSTSRTDMLVFALGFVATF
jgi:hypothetical protein